MLSTIAKPMLWDGAKHLALFKGLQYVGFIQNAPSLIALFAFGAIDGMQVSALTNLKNKLIQNEHGAINQWGREWAIFEFLLVCGSRYLIARAWNHLFGGNITAQFIHTYNALDLIQHTSWKLIYGALWATMLSKSLSIFTKMPELSSFFFFGIIHAALDLTVNYLNSHYQIDRFIKKQSLIRVDIAQKAAALISFAATCYVSTKTSNTLFNLNIPISYLYAASTMMIVRLKCLPYQPNQSLIKTLEEKAKTSIQNTACSMVRKIMGYFR